MRRDLVHPVRQPGGLGARALLLDPLRREGAGAARQLNGLLRGLADTRRRTERRDLDDALDDLADVLGRREIAAERVGRQRERLHLGGDAVEALALALGQSAVTARDGAHDSAHPVVGARLDLVGLGRGLARAHAIELRGQIGGALGGVLRREFGLDQLLVQRLVLRQRRLDPVELVARHDVGRALLLDLGQARVVGGLKGLESGADSIDRALQFVEFHWISLSWRGWKSRA